MKIEDFVNWVVNRNDVGQWQGTIDHVLNKENYKISALYNAMAQSLPYVELSYASKIGVAKITLITPKNTNVKFGEEQISMIDQACNLLAVSSKSIKAPETEKLIAKMNEYIYSSNSSIGDTNITPE